jgi:molybdopterin-containing oxidoreductase family membrane subunit
MVVCCVVIPLPILVFRRTVGGTVIASLAINVGMWLERYTIVVPTLSNPRLPYQVQMYRPTWVEAAITVASFAMLIFLYGVFVKLFPIVSIWEVQEGRELAREKPAAAALPAAGGQLLPAEAVR